jgi:hypothetical protein
MNKTKRLVISFLFAAIVLFIGMLYWPFILKNIVEPAALAVWLLLRILVLSIDQKYFWYAAILIAIIFLFRLLPKEQSAIQADTQIQVNATIANIGYWRVLFTYDGKDIRNEKTLKRQLIQLLTALYASKQNTTNSFRIYDALQQGELPLPEHIHAFLFSDEPQEVVSPLRRFIQFIRTTPRKWIRQWTGEEKVDHYRMINEVLDFLETSLEMKT